MIFAADVTVATGAVLSNFADLETIIEPSIDASNFAAVAEGLLLSQEALDVQVVLANMRLQLAVELRQYPYVGERQRQRDRGPFQWQDLLYFVSAVHDLPL